MLHAGTYFHIVYDDGTAFVLDRAGARVWADWPAPLTYEDTLTYFLGPVMGFVLRLRGFVCLHASAFWVAAGAVALVGDTGYGKSTTVAALAQRGMPVLSDDLLVLRERNSTLHVVPTFPEIKLWPDSTAFLFGSPEALRRISPTHATWDKRFVNLQAGPFTFVRDDALLAAVYVLQPRQANQDAPSVHDLPPRARLTALLENTYSARYADGAMRAQAFRVLAHLASTVPVRSVTPHVDPARIGRLCDLILDDLARYAPRAPAAAAR